MPVTINASTSTGLVQSADNSGTVEIQSNGTTKLTVGSTGVNIGQYNPSASLITSGTSVASTSGTSIDFTSIPNWVKRITIMFSGVSLSGSSDFLIQIGSGSFATSGYTSTSTAANSAAATSAGSSTSGFFVLTGTSSNTASGHIILTNITSNAWVSSHTAKETTGRVVMGGGDVSLSGTLDRVRITTVNGTDTFDAGTINILYE